MRRHGADRLDAAGFADGGEDGINRRRGYAVNAERHAHNVLETDVGHLRAIEADVFVAGRAGGKLKSGIHVDGNGDSCTRVGLTIQQALGLPVNKWGTGSMETNKTIGEIMA